MKIEILKQANQIQGEIERLLEVSDDLCKRIDSYNTTVEMKQIYKDIVNDSFREKIGKLEDTLDRL